MSMRIIAGKYRHRHLTYPENNPKIRPTKDRIREAFFSSLGDIEGLCFLDLYAGCGAMGIEAISRGAAISYFVDNNYESVNYVKENLKSLDIRNAEVFYLDDFAALEKFKDNHLKFDIIYIDPPYESGKYEEVLAYIFNNDLINNNFVIALESQREVTIDSKWNLKIKEYHYGEIRVITLRKSL